MALSQRAKNLAATGLFKQYVGRFIFRAVVFAYAIYLFIADSDQLLISKYFGFAEGFNPVDFFFLAILADISTKFFPEARVAMGSLKQYRRYQVPTVRAFKGGKKAFLDFIKTAIAEGKIALSGGVEKGKKPFEETAETIAETVEDVEAFAVAKAGNAVNALEESAVGVVDYGAQILRDVGLMRLLPFEDHHFDSGEEFREQIRRDRTKEIVPVIIFWIVFNFVIGFMLANFNMLNEQTVMLWTLFYFVFDIFSVVFWCPIQLFIMRNRCCTTCQIFNWDAIMTTTPLLVVLFASPFAWILVLLSVIVLVRWELAFVRHPERFDDRTNASLRCGNCTDKLCYLRAPLPDKNPPLQRAADK